MASDPDEEDEQDWTMTRSSALLQYKVSIQTNKYDERSQTLRTGTHIVERVANGDYEVNNTD